MKLRPSNSYRVMDKYLQSYKIAGNDIEHLKQYCRYPDVIVSLKVKIIGFKFRILFMKFYKPFYKHKFINLINILWMHIGLDWETHDKTDKIVWKAVKNAN